MFSWLFSTSSFIDGFDYSVFSLAKLVLEKANRFLGRVGTLSKLLDYLD